MLSHLRFHRRAPSNPTSPASEQLTPLTPLDSMAQQPSNVYVPGERLQPDISGLDRPSSSSAAPSLPPIMRVTSADASDRAYGMEEVDRAMMQQELAARGGPSPASKSPYSPNSGFLGGVALRNFQRGAQQDPPAWDSLSVPPKPLPTPHAAAAGRGVPPPPHNVSPSGPGPGPGPGSRPPLPPKDAQKSAPTFVTPTDRQNASKRPPGPRLATEPSMSSLSSSTNSEQPPKNKKGLPFLKNPMSTLLMRRKQNHNVPDIMPLPLAESYDPRIRGTKVHDFSAPRPRRPATHGTDINMANQASAAPNRPPSQSRSMMDGEWQRSRGQSDASINKGLPDPRKPAPPQEVTPAQAVQDHHTLDLPQIEKSLPGSPAPPVPPKDKDIIQPEDLQTHPSVESSPDGASAAAPEPKPTKSTRTTASRSISMSTMSSFRGALPKHMKSTSSRFSFDMVGAAKQEKLMEERHRQRALEKQATAPSNTRDSRFDDFDEDAFDYDAMMEDDGLEERIPGVNADFDEEEEDLAIEDPDNDQENFAGFVFQRSNPSSSLTSPVTAGMAKTPRDEAGSIIGFAFSKDTPGLPPGALEVATVTQGDKAPTTAEKPLPLGPISVGLGIQEPGATSQAEEHVPPEVSPSSLSGTPPEVPSKSGSGRHATDELYFDDGLLDELDFRQEDSNGQPSVPFDESLFDLNDTDEHGRPIPGAFAHALSVRSDERRRKRESDLTSGLSAQSPIMSESTAHTSISASQHLGSLAQKSIENPLSAEPTIPAPIPGFPATEQEKVAAYQAALAAAAHKAAASGKFRRRSLSPEPGPGLDGITEVQHAVVGMPTDVTITSPTDSAMSERSPHTQPGGMMPAADPYDDDDVGNGLAGYEDDADDDYDYGFDDDDIIAEANASALANDSDGWYGQEFGFYSAPVPVNKPHGHGANGSAGGSGSGSNGAGSGPGGKNGAASGKLVNGGYFGPAGLSLNTVNRSTSGRVASREPNLTPITERSEYSNRNSIMSTTLSWGNLVPPSAGGPVPSPGLAQLAMMDEGVDDGSMTLTALLRLRNKAWGGSQSSLVANNAGGGGSGTGSPREGGGSASPGTWAAAAAAAAGHGRKNSAFSLWSRDSDAGGGAGSGTQSPTLTGAGAFAAVGLGASPLAMARSDEGNGAETELETPMAQGGVTDSAARQLGMAVDGSEAQSSLMPQPLFSVPNSHRNSSQSIYVDALTTLTSNTTGGGSTSDGVAVAVAVAQPDEGESPAPKRPQMGHRHKGSADSISYVQETETDSGETHWVVERRRPNADGGELEVVEREVVEMGRI